MLEHPILEEQAEVVAGGDNGTNGTENGCAGGIGNSAKRGAESWYGAGGGAGNPGGIGNPQTDENASETNSSGGNAGMNGTGGLLIIYTDIFQNNGNITSDGSSGGYGYRAGGGGSGGGSINIFYNSIENEGIITANGGKGGKVGRATEGAAGADGGRGSITKGSVSTGDFIQE